QAVLSLPTRAPLHVHTPPFYSNSFLLFFFQSSGHHRYLHSFPTRRSSDLMSFEARLAELKITLPPAPKPVATYVPAVRAGDLLLDRKSTRLNSSHVSISYAVFCLKKKKKIN